MRAFARCYNLSRESPRQIVAKRLTLKDVVKARIHSLYQRGHIRSSGGLVWLTAKGRLEAKWVLGERSIADPSIASRVRRDPHKLRHDPHAARANDRLIKLLEAKEEQAQAEAIKVKTAREQARVEAIKKEKAKEEMAHRRMIEWQIEGRELELERGLSR
jgi:hypothetical protein